MLESLPKAVLGREGVLVPSLEGLLGREGVCYRRSWRVNLKYTRRRLECQGPRNHRVYGEFSVRRLLRRLPSQQSADVRHLSGEAVRGTAGIHRIPSKIRRWEDPSAEGHLPDS